MHCSMTPYLVYNVGRGAKEANLYTEISEGIYSYGITRHRHGTILF
jgi:N-acetyl-gamma-glutamylphosphate reductase